MRSEALTRLKDKVAHMGGLAEEQLGLALDALQRYAGYRGTGHRVLRIARVRDAIPQYVKGHGERLGRIWMRRGQAHNRGLRLIGNSYRAIAMVPQLARTDERAGRAGTTEVLRPGEGPAAG